MLPQISVASILLAFALTSSAQQLGVSNLTSTEDRGYTCAGRPTSLSDYPKIQDCLTALFVFPFSGIDEDFKKKEAGGFLPAYPTYGKCKVSLEFRTRSINQERSNWLTVSQVASNLAFMCQYGDEGRTAGTVIFGESGNLQLTIDKATRNSVSGGDDGSDGASNVTANSFPPQISSGSIETS